MKRGPAVALAILVISLLTSVPLYADNPVLTFLQTTVQTALNNIQASLAAVHTTLNGISGKVNQTPRFVAVRTTFVTQPSSITPRNIDVAATLPFLEVKRYTVNVFADNLLSAAPGTDNIKVIVGVIDDNSVASDVTIAQKDPALGALQAGPYVGTNSFIQVIRGADGLGPVNVTINAVVELEQQ